MSINLIESERRTQRSLGGTFVSVAVHACLISLAVYATASAVEPHASYERTIDIWPATPTASPAPARTTRAAPRPASQRAPVAPHTSISIPTTIPTILPPIDLAQPPTSDSALFGDAIGDSGAPGTVVGGDGGGSGQPMFAAQVEKPATPRSGNPAPRYPSLLESSHVEGSVLVQFVVDTLGVVDLSTFKVLESSNDLFAEATRASLAKWRFSPAEAGGRKVKQIVQLPLRFVAPRH